MEQNFKSYVIYHNDKRNYYKTYHYYIINNKIYNNNIYNKIKYLMLYQTFSL